MPTRSVGLHTLGAIHDLTNTPEVPGTTPPLPTLRSQGARRLGQKKKERAVSSARPATATRKGKAPSALEQISSLR